jgi:hypothetical protein
MPTSFQFLVFSDLPGMHDARVKTQIRKHAMKDIGASRRRPSRQPSKVALEIRQTVTYPNDPPNSTPHQPKHHPFFLDDLALYDPHARALSCQPDPFSSASVPIDNVSHGLLQYFRHYSTQFPNNFTFTPHIAGVFDQAVRDELMMNCILSAAASRFRYMQGDTSPSDFAERALSWTQRSLRLLQIRLHRDLPVTTASVEPLVDCVLYLAAAALYRGDEASAGIHVGAAVRVVELSGGLGVLEDPRVVIRLLGLDDVLACRGLRACSFACTYDPGLLLPCGEYDCRADPELTDSRSGGHSISIGTALPKTLRDLIPQIVECDRLQDAPGSTGGELSSHELLISIHRQKLRGLAVRNRLLSFSGTDLTTRALKLVLIIWTLLPPNDPRQAKNAGVVAGHLMQILSDSSADDWAGSDEVELWCLLVGFFGGSIGGGGHVWFAERIHGVIRSKGQRIGLALGPGLFEGLIDLQKRFLHRDAVTRTLTLRLVELLDRNNEGSVV